MTSKMPIAKAVLNHTVSTVVNSNNSL